MSTNKFQDLSGEGSIETCSFLGGSLKKYLVINYINAYALIDGLRWYYIFNSSSRLIAF
jgi:hypothetical protein